MSFMTEDEVSADFPFDCGRLAEEIALFTLEYEDFPYEAEINLTLTDNEGIRAINKEYRDVDAPTDVLSFPMLTFEEAGVCPDFESDYDDNFNPDTGEIMLGDIIISVDRVKEQAIEYGHSEKREFAFLVVHSMLHLLGYDHMVPQEAEVMERKQREILEAMNILRE